MVARMGDGPDLETAPEGCEPLGEDESVQIMERPSLGGNRRTAKHFAMPSGALSLGDCP